ncbi:site-specific integrase [Nocardioides sp. TF02-7]|uniref:site-specific integrase n=1 Tax=Nocardioides sp. TF02-7 TaxID=2917724 RepID=UPI001F06DFFC|nr:site-specific integrase [Nocardioides sp. TF02-7]UMG93994.1 site-specific integrase [Nocardioides sp. TF02-7]
MTSQHAPRDLLPFQPAKMTPAQPAAVSFLARYSGPTHHLYAYQLRRWFAWCETNGIDALIGVERAHVELYIRSLTESGLMASSVVTLMHGVRGYFRFAHIDALTPTDPAVYARLPEVHRDESRTQGLDRLELIRFLQVAQTISVHHGALAHLLGINALRASEAAAVRIEDYAETLRGHRVLRRSARATSPPPCQSLSRFFECSRHAEASGAPDPSSCVRSPASRLIAVTSIGWSSASPGPQRFRDTSALTRCATPRSPTPSTLASRCGTPRSSLGMPTREPPSTTTVPEETSTATASTSSPRTSQTYSFRGTPPR